VNQSKPATSVTAASPRPAWGAGGSTWQPTKPCGPKLHTAERAERKNHPVSSSSSPSPSPSSSTSHPHTYKTDRTKSNSSQTTGAGSQKSIEVNVDEIKGVDPKFVELIENEIVDNSPGVKWDDIGIFFSSILPCISK
jgi:hypothetical protein